MQYRKGKINSTTALIASGVTLPLGFVPDRFTITNYTKTIAAPAAGVAYSQWFRDTSPQATAIIDTYTAGAPVRSLLATTGISEVVIGADWKNTVYTVTNISSANPGVVTVDSPQPTNSLPLVNGMTFTMSSVVGMKDINTKRFVVSNLSGSTFSLYDTFGKPVNTTVLGTYVSGGQMDVISYPPMAPVLNPINGQVLTPATPAGLQLDEGYQGLSLGAGVLGADGDVLVWEAFYETPTGY